MQFTPYAGVPRNAPLGMSILHQSPHMHQSPHPSHVKLNDAASPPRFGYMYTRNKRVRDRSSFADQLKIEDLWMHFQKVAEEIVSPAVPAFYKVGVVVMVPCCIAIIYQTMSAAKTKLCHHRVSCAAYSSN